MLENIHAENAEILRREAQRLSGKIDHAEGRKDFTQRGADALRAFWFLSALCVKINHAENAKKLGLYY